MVDQEPKRSVELIRRIDSRIPTPTLSSAIASTPSSSVSSHSLGRLADLRAPPPPRPIPGRSPNASPAPSTSSGSRAWTSVVARPQAPLAPKPVVSANAWRPTQAPPSERRQESPRPSSHLVQLRPSVTLNDTVPDRAGEDIPDSWEDEV